MVARDYQSPPTLLTSDNIVVFSYLFNRHTGSIRVYKWEPMGTKEAYGHSLFLSPWIKLLFSRAVLGK